MKDNPAIKVGVALAGAVEEEDGPPAGGTTVEPIGVEEGEAVAAPCRH